MSMDNKMDPMGNNMKGMQFKKGLGWKACYDEERNLYTAQTSWRGDYHLYEINEEIWDQLGEPDVDADELIHSGRPSITAKTVPSGHRQIW